MRTCSLTVGAPSYWNLKGLPSPYISLIFGSSFDKSKASTKELDVKTPKASSVKVSTLTALSIVLFSSANPVNKSFLFLNLSICILSLRSFIISPFGLNGLCVSPK